MEEFESDHLIVFLNQAENYSEFYITGNKNGVIETDFFTLKSLNKDIQDDINKLFNAEYLKFKEWRENEIVFSDTIILQPYSNTDSSKIYPLNVPTSPVDVMNGETTLNNNSHSNNNVSTTAPPDIS